MTDTPVKENAATGTEKSAAAPSATPAATSTAAPARGNRSHSSHGGGNREFRKNRRAPRRQQPRQEFEQKMLAIRRVTRVSSGGRRFSFSVAMAIGDKKGKIGVGTGKANDTALAIEKAIKDAKKNMITVKRTNTFSIPHEVTAKYSSAVVKLQPSAGRGIVAGSALRDLSELAGLNDVVGKVISGSKNKLNIARATVKAFETLSAPKASHALPKKAVTKKDN